MARRSEPNAQNSELNPKAHPSGAHIEQMYKNANQAAGDAGEFSDTPRGVSSGANREMPVEGARSEILRPSEREDSRYISPDDSPAEGSRDDSTMAPHRMSADDRESR